MVKLLLPLALIATVSVAVGQSSSNAAPKAVPAPSESATLAKVRPGLATLADAGRFLGTAVLIGADGQFIAHRSALRGIGRDGIIATLTDGTKVRLFIDARDTPTQFVLLQARPWTGGITPIKTVPGSPAPGTPLVAVLGESTFRAQISPRERIGIDKNTSRMLPLTELTFENTNGIVGGSALFTPAGEFFGYVTAVLTPSEALTSSARSIGPANLVIGYSMAPDVTRRAVEGFLSPSKRPQVASVGIVCRDAPNLNGQGGGALVEAIDPTSPAAKAGLMLGDVIIEIGGEPIKDQVAFAKRLYALKPGEKVQFRIRRGASEVRVDVVLGLSPSPTESGG